MKNRQFIKEFEAHTNYLKCFALKLTKDKNLAEDLFQDTALKAFRYQDKYVANTNIKAWLGTIMKNSFINLYRKKKKRNEVQDTTVEKFFLNDPNKVNLNEGEMVVNVKELYKIIDSLDEGLRRPFLMSYQGYKYEEIQKAMGDLPMGTIKSRIFHARKALKTRVKKLYEHAEYRVA